LPPSASTSSGFWVDPVSRVVLVKFSSRPQPSDDAATVLEIHMLG
jgi:hypothetical protein